MTPFKKTRLASSRTIGERLREHRLELQLSIDETVQATKINKKYLEAIEQGDYKKLPGEVYIRNFLKKYAEFLRLNINEVIGQYEKEHGVVKQITNQGPRFVQRHIDAKPLLTPKRLRRLGFIIVVLIVLGYIAWQVWSIVKPPELIIEYPPARLTTLEQTIEVSGSTEPESTVTINGQEVLINAKGQFSEEVSLQVGLNTIKVISKKERSQARTIIQRVLVQEKEE
ncbi:MAG: helix-turn-helix domain-containing protein [bacterium]